MSFAVSFGLFAIASLLCLVGMAALALSQDRNWRSMGIGVAPAGWVRPLGWGLILSALILCILRDGASFAALIWPMLLAAAAFLIGMALAYRPTWLRPLAQSFVKTGSTPRKEPS
ncbi:MAG: DUF3325 domain-containing protein [Pseudomonadota bacterium]